MTELRKLGTRKSPISMLVDLVFNMLKGDERVGINEGTRRTRNSPMVFHRLKGDERVGIDDKTRRTQNSSISLLVDLVFGGV